MMMMMMQKRDRIMGEKTKELDQGEQNDCTDIVSCSVPDATDEVHHFCVKRSPPPTPPVHRCIIRFFGIRQLHSPAYHTKHPLLSTVVFHKTVL